MVACIRALKPNRFKNLPRIRQVLPWNLISSTQPLRSGQTKGHTLMTTTNQPTAVAYPRATNGFAITAFVLSILGVPAPLLLLPVGAALGILSLTFGIIALRQINARGEDGRGLAIASLVLSSISTLIFVAFVIFIAIFLGAAVHHPSIH